MSQIYFEWIWSKETLKSKDLKKYHEIVESKIKQTLKGHTDSFPLIS